MKQAILIIFAYCGFFASVWFWMEDSRQTGQKSSFYYSHTVMGDNNKKNNAVWKSAGRQYKPSSFKRKRHTEAEWGSDTIFPMYTKRARANSYTYTSVPTTRRSASYACQNNRRRQSATGGINATPFLAGNTGSRRTYRGVGGGNPHIVSYNNSYASARFRAPNGENTPPPDNGNGGTGSYPPPDNGGGGGTGGYPPPDNGGGGATGGYPPPDNGGNTGGTGGYPPPDNGGGGGGGLFPPPDNGEGNTGGYPPPDNELPLSDGIPLLLAMCAVYGRVIMGRKKERKM